MRRSTKSCLVIAVGTLCAAGLSHTAGATTTWTNASGDSSWANAANWSSGVPTAADTAFLSAAGTILLPATPPASANSVFRSAFMGSPITLSGGKLSANLVRSFSQSAPLIVASDLGSPTGALQLNSVITTGTLGDGAGGGSFHVIANDTKLRGPSTSSGDLLLFGSSIEQAGSFPIAARAVVLGSGTITASSAFPTIDRLPDTGELRLFKSQFVFDASAAGATTESTGTIVLDSAHSIVRLKGPTSGGSLLLTASALARDPDTTMSLELSGAAALRFAQSPTGPNGSNPADRAVLGFGVGTVSDGTTTRLSFLTYDSGANPNDITDDPGLRPLDWNTELATSLAAGGNVRLSGSQTLGTPASVRSLNLVDGSLQLNAAPLNIASGLLLQGSAAGTGVGGSGSLVFTSEAVALAYGRTQSYRMDVPIHASRFTKGGDGELVVTQPIDAPGGTTVNNGTLTSRVAGGLGQATVTLSGGVIRVEQASQTIPAIRVASTFVEQTDPIRFNFTINAGSMFVAQGTTVTIHRIDGDSGLQFSGAGRVLLPAGSTSRTSLHVFGGGELRFDGELGTADEEESLRVSIGLLTGNGGRIHGTLDAQSDLGAVIAPGPGIGRITADTLSLGWSFTVSQSVPVLQFDLNGTDPSMYDQLIATRAVFLDPLLVSATIGYPARVGDSFTIIDNLGAFAISQHVTNLPEGAILTTGGYPLRVSYVGGDGNDMTLTVVPEPLSIAYAAAAAQLGVRLLRRRRPSRNRRSTEHPTHHPI